MRGKPRSSGWASRPEETSEREPYSGVETQTRRVYILANASGTRRTVLTISRRHRTMASLELSTCRRHRSGARRFAVPLCRPPLHPCGHRSIGYGWRHGRAGVLLDSHVHHGVQTSHHPRCLWHAMAAPSCPPAMNLCAVPITAPSRSAALAGVGLGRRALAAPLRPVFRER